MVNWVGDGGLAGYNPTTRRLTNDLFKFTTNGVSVDLNGATRLQYKFQYAGNEGISKTFYPNTLRASATFTVTAADVAAYPSGPGHPTKGFTGMMLVVKASAFAEGVTPTPAQLWAVPDSEVLYMVLADQYRSTAGSLPLKFMYDPDYHEINYPANTKLWVLITPVVYNVGEWTGGAVNRTIYKPPIGSPVSTRGRALSVWTNRTPTKPVITSPTNNTEHVLGSEFTLAYESNDPDSLLSPDDAERFNRDIAGVQFQYAAVPDDPNDSPNWQTIPYNANFLYFHDIRESFAAFIRYDSQGLKGQRPELDPEGDFYYYWRQKMVEQLGIPVFVGPNRRSDDSSGRGWLPGGGDWLLRVRTFDWGHPYPQDWYLGYRESDPETWAPAPLGVNTRKREFIYGVHNVWPEENASPWSDPVKIRVPVQVPPPIPLSPINDTAIPSGTSVPLKWRYRNTHVDNLGQRLRRVQIRKATDPEWTQVIAGFGSDDSVLLPPVWDPSGVPMDPSPVEFQSDVGFETGTLEGWSVVDYIDFATLFSVGGYTGPGSIPAPPAGVSGTLVNDPAKAQEGDRFLKISSSKADWENTFGMYGVGKVLDIANDLPPGYLNIGVSAWANPRQHPDEDPDSEVLSGGFLQINFLDEDGKMTEALNTMAKLVEFNVTAVDTWEFKEIEPIPIPTTAHYIAIFVTAGTPVMTATNAVDTRLDDIRITLTHDFDQHPFVLEAGNPYEWRVQAGDTAGALSAWSDAGRFWVVPASGSGDVKPPALETIDDATLGCGTHRVFIYRRGGTTRVGEITGITHVDWSRVRDDISTAEIVVENWGIDCGNLLSSLKCWAYELVIYRDNGYTTDRVWEGPITLITYESDRVVIDAKDVMAYAYRRILKERMSDAGRGNGTTVVDRARRVLQSALASDDPNVLAYLNPVVSGNDAMQYRSTPAYSRTAFEEVDDMAANAGLDYTCSGRAIILWGTKNRIGTLPEFRDKDLGSLPIVSEYGMSMANFYAVSDGNGVFGTATRLVDDQDPVYGRVEMLSSTWASDSESDTGTFTQQGRETVIESFKGYAERSIDSRYPPPVVVRVPDNTTINPEAVLSIQNLIPGTVIPLRSTATLRTVVALQKLDSVKVTEENGSETISITMSPFSRDDTEVEGGEA